MFPCKVTGLTVFLYMYHLSIIKYNLKTREENHIGGIMVRVHVSSVVDCGYESQSVQTKDCKIGVCCFSARQAALRRKSKY